MRGGGKQRQLLADAVEEELEAVAEPLGGISGKSRCGELVLDPVHSQLRLPDAALGQLELRLFFDGVAEHVVERSKGSPAGPVSQGGRSVVRSGQSNRGVADRSVQGLPTKPGATRLDANHAQSSSLTTLSG